MKEYNQAISSIFSTILFVGLVAVISLTTFFTFQNYNAQHFQSISTTVDYQKVESSKVLSSNPSQVVIESPFKSLNISQVTLNGMECLQNLGIQESTIIEINITSCSSSLNTSQVPKLLIKTNDLKVLEYELLELPINIKQVFGGLDCFLNTSKIKDGASAIFYNITSGLTCTNLSRTCNDGILSGDINFKYISCSLLTSIQDLSLANSSASFIGEGVDDGSGISLSNAGDVNGDGYDDFLIGAYLNDDGSFNSGKTYLFFGKSNEFDMDINLSFANASFIGEVSNDLSGFSVSGAGDVNNDGFDDILIGAHRNLGSRGKTYLILGKSNGWIKNQSLSTANASFIGELADDYSGYSLSGAGDVNNDSYDDFLIGAYGRNNGLGDGDGGGDLAGETYLILGKSSGWMTNQVLSTANASFIGESLNDYSGFSLSGAGDVNGDGYDDILISAPYKTTFLGKTYIIFGKNNGWSMDQLLSTANASFIGETPGHFSGFRISNANDVNNDGFDDILISAPLSSSGEVYLVLGKSSGWSINQSLSTANASYVGEITGDQLGISVSGAGDVNNDGYDDILIGASNNDEGGSNSGQTYLIYGKSSDFSMDINVSTSDASFIGENVNDESGTSVSGVGDINNDGYDDILISASGNDEGGSNSGQTYLITNLVN